MAENEIGARETTASAKPEKHFHHRLESIRGIAALFVAIHHSIFMIETTGTIGAINRMLSSIFYGRGAVICFFVLSGLVLGESLKRTEQRIVRDTLLFYLKRALRIFPAVIVVVALSFFILCEFQFWKVANPAETANYTVPYSFIPTFADYLKNIALYNIDLNPPMWSLTVEVIASVLLPVFYFASKTRTLKIIWLIGLYALPYFALPQRWLGEGAFCLWMFFLGYLIPEIPNAFFKSLARNRLLLYALTAIAAGVFVTTFHFGHHRTPCCLALTFLIATVSQLPHDRLYSILDWNIFRFYGRISFSFYLLHWLVVYAFSSWMFRHYAPETLTHQWFIFAFGLTVTSVAAATALAMLNYRVVETPFMLLGKRIGRKERRAAI